MIALEKSGLFSLFLPTAHWTFYNPTPPKPINSCKNKMQTIRKNGKWHTNQGNIEARFAFALTDYYKITTMK